ncbi:MAG: hypothetical protein LAO06_02595 [Acidobacteriia bacterium]|nr:hypothetical protein [Terriglobia bacterium]
MKSKQKPITKSWYERHGQIVRKALADIHAADYHPDTGEDFLGDISLPSEVSQTLMVACFISGTVLAAQNAEREHGVPTSLLIASARYREGEDYRSLRPDVKTYFSRLAQRLKDDQSFRPALAVAGNPDALVEELRRSGVEEAKDLISSIERYGLDELNVVHVTPEEISQRRLEEYHVFGVVKDALADAFSPRKIHPARLRNVAAWAKLLLDECEAERKGDEQ